jgi:DNA-binding transcriptional LysR family regulator
LDLDWLDDFLTLASQQNFSRAAAARNVTQPAFSRRIQMLEKWVGTPLFQRLPRRVVLTPAGERFHAAVETMPLALRHARTEALDAADRSAKMLSIAATHALSFTFFPSWARETIDAASVGALNLLSDSMAACEDMMLRGEASFLLCHRHASEPGRLPARQFRHRVVGQDTLVPCTAPDEAGRPRWAATADGSSPVPYLAYAPQSGLGRILEADWRARDVAPDLQQIMTVRLAAALLTMAEEGRGVAWLPLSLAADSLASGRLVRATDEASLSTAVEIVLYRPVARLGAAAEAFWNGVRSPA